MSQPNRQPLSTILESEAGVSILSVLVGFAMMSVLMGMLADAAVLSAKVQRTATIQTEFNGFADSLRLLLAHEAQCTPALQGATVTFPLTLKDPLDPSHTIGAVGDHHLAGWTITRIELQNVKPVPGTPNLQYAKLFVEARKEMTHAIGAPLMGREVSDVYFESAAGKITRCYGSESWLTTAEANCKMLGGVWATVNGVGSCVIPSAGQPQQQAAAPAADNDHTVKEDKEKGDHNNDGHLDNGVGSSASGWGDSTMKISKK